MNGIAGVPISVLVLALLTFVSLLVLVAGGFTRIRLSVFKSLEIEADRPPVAPKPDAEGRSCQSSPPSRSEVGGGDSSV